MDPAVERRLPHFDGDEDGFVECEEHRDLDQDRQAARGRVHLLRLVQLHHLVLHLLRHVFVLLAQLLHPRREQLHLAHRPIGVVRQRKEQRLDEDGERDDGEAEIAQHGVQEIEAVEDRLGQEIEPAEIDRLVEVGDVEFRLVVVEQRDDLGAGEHMGGLPRRCAGQDGLAVLSDEIDLVAVSGTLGQVAELRLHRNRLVGDQGCQPVFVGDTGPAARGGGIERDAAFLVALGLRLVVGGFLQRAVEHAVHALEQDVVAGDLGLVVATDARPWEQRDRLVAGVDHRLVDGEHVVVIDRQFELEGQALAVVPGQCRRVTRGDGLPGGGPQGVVVRELDRLAGRSGPAILHIVGLPVRPRLQQPDQGRIRGQRLAVVFQDDVVDARAEQADRAFDALAPDRKARHVLRHGRHGGLGGGAGRGFGRGNAGQVLCRRNAGQRCLGLGCYLRVRGRRQIGAHHPLEAEQDRNRNGDREE